MEENNYYGIDFEAEDGYAPPPPPRKKKKRRRKNKKKIFIRNTVFVLILAMIILLIARCAIKGGGDDDETTAVTTSPVTTEAVTTEALPTDYAAAIQAISGQLSSPKIFVYDIETDEYIFQKSVTGNDALIYPASMTVLFTSLYAMSVIQPDTVITVTPEALALVPKGSVTAKVYKNQQLTLSMLIEGMVVASGCDCAYVTAVEVGRTIAKNTELPAEEAVERFIIGIEEWLEKNGFNGTVIKDPYGLSDENYTTAQDLTLVSKYCLKDRVISAYLGIYSAKVYYVSGQTVTWTNKNLILSPEGEYYSEYATGVKTGTINSQNSLISSCSIEEDGNTRFIIGTFGSEDSKVRFADTKLIIDTLVSAQ